MKMTEDGILWNALEDYTGNRETTPCTFAHGLFTKTSVFSVFIVLRHLLIASQIYQIVNVLQSGKFNLPFTESSFSLTEELTN